MKAFDHNGIVLFGAHRGTHARKLPSGWMAWASANIEGFKEAHEAARAIEPPTPPRVRKPTGRRYILNPHLRYIP